MKNIVTKGKTKWHFLNDVILAAKGFGQKWK